MRFDRLARTARTSLRALSAHKTRALLALASIAAGVAAVVITSAISVGVQREVMQQMQSMGSNLLVVRPAQVKRRVARKTISGVVTSLAHEDYEAIAELALVARAAPGAEGGMRVKSGNSVVPTKVLGTTPAFPLVRQFQLSTGRFFDAQENASAHRVAVLGARVSAALFGSDDPVGREIRVRGVPYEVIGVLRAKGVLADGSDEDNQVIVPIRTALRRVLNTTWLNAVFVSVHDPEQMDLAAAEIRKLLRQRHRLDASRPDDFAVQNTVRSLQMQRQTAASLSLFATGLGAVALFIGGTGILALMLLSVKERTGEIGLRMAVGATQLDILVQFLLEASLLAFGGWASGLVLGALAGIAVAFGTQWAVAVPLPALFASFAMAAIIGLGFGAWPARKAARLSPIEAFAMQ
jgi:putative ABC transport system permease protein